MSIIRVGLAETKRFAEGYDAIFGAKMAAPAKKPAKSAPAKKGAKSAPAKKPAKSAPAKSAPAKKKTVKKK